jgi:hypothetical protein
MDLVHPPSPPLADSAGQSFLGKILEFEKPPFPAAKYEQKQVLLAAEEVKSKVFHIMLVYCLSGDFHRNSTASPFAS